MKCINCNAEIATNAKFCSHCGAKVTQQAPSSEEPDISLHSNSVIGSKTYTRLIISLLLLLVAHSIENSLLTFISWILLLSAIISLRKHKNTVGKTKKKEDIPLIRLSHPINLRYKYVKQFLGARKVVPTSLDEQKMLKSTFLKIYPDNMFYDDLNEESSDSSEGNTFILSKTDCPINLRSIYKQTSKGRRKEIETSTAEQKRLKKAILMIYPDNMFYDDLYEANSIKRTTNSRDDRDINYDWMTTEDIKEYFLYDNHNYDCDSEGTNCADDCDCASDYDCDCTD